MDEELVIAKYLVSLGYKQVSSKYHLVAKVEVTEEDLRQFFLKENFYNSSSSIPSLPIWDQEDQWRRCYANHHKVPEAVLRCMRSLGAVAH